jgi:hypothetical protein
MLPVTKAKWQVPDRREIIDGIPRASVGKFDKTRPPAGRRGGGHVGIDAGSCLGGHGRAAVPLPCTAGWPTYRSTAAAAAAPRVWPRAMGEAWLRHGIGEMGNLGDFLPQLYQREADE